MSLCIEYGTGGMQRKCRRIKTLLIQCKRYIHHIQLENGELGRPEAKNAPGHFLHSSITVN